MYYTPGWGILATSVVGVVGVAGTLAAAWTTQRHTNDRFERERRDRHYQDQRQAIAEVVVLAKRTAGNTRRVASWLGESPPRRDGDDVSETIKQMMADDSAWFPAVVAAELIIGDRVVLESLSRLKIAFTAAEDMLTDSVVESGSPPAEWLRDLRRAADTLSDLSLDLTSVTRQRFWSDLV